MKSLFKTTLIIWSEYDGDAIELTELARAAATGDAYCSYQISVKVEDPTQDEHWDGTEFFGEYRPSDGEHWWVRGPDGNEVVYCSKRGDDLWYEGRNIEGLVDGAVDGGVSFVQKAVLPRALKNNPA